ncbi:MAG: YtxH domain-containing protein [Leeuwenhoekiella sp.]
MNKQNKGKGLLAILGVIGGALAIWKYKSLSPAEKSRLKESLSDVSEQVTGKVKDIVSDVESGANSTYKDLKKATGKA